MARKCSYCNNKYPEEAFPEHWNECLEALIVKREIEISILALTHQKIQELRELAAEKPSPS